MSITIQDLEIFLNHSTEIIGVLDAEGIVLKANKSWEKTFSKPLDTIIGLHLYQLFSPNDELHYKELFQKLFIEEKVGQHYFSLVNKEGELIIIDMRVVYVDKLIYLKGRESTKEDSLLQSLQMMSRVAKIGAWHYNVSLKKFSCSEECRRIFNYNETDEFSLQTVFEQYQPSYSETIIELFDKLLNKLTPFEYTGKILSKNGLEKWVDFKAEIISHHEDYILVSGIIADVTKEQNYLETLRHHTDTQRLALKGIKSGIFDHNLITDMVYYSEKFKQMLGLSLQDSLIPESRFREMIHPDDQEPSMLRHLDGIKAEGYHYYNHFRLRNINDQYNHYEVHAWRKKDKKTKKTTRMIGNLIDIEDKVQKQLAISQYQRRLKAVINNGYLYTILLDRNAEILFVDKSTKKAIKKEFGVNISKGATNFKTVFPKNFDSAFNLHFKSALKGKKLIKEINRIIPSGATIWYEMSYTPIKDDAGSITSILINFLNITSRKKAELQFIEAKKKTEELSQLKSSILMNLSHEIRTPLNGIIGVNELLNRPLKSDERQELLSMQKESSTRLINTLEGMINLSQLDSLNNSLNLKRLDVIRIIEKSHEEQLHLALSKKLNFVLELNEHPVFILGDYDLFKVAIDQLFNNAIKYTIKGTITVKTDIKNAMLRILVKDTGVGIKQENLKKIFEMFVQESQGLSRKYEGTGIGLTMAKKYIELMDGTIKVKSEINKGSCFTLKFPLLK